MPLLIRLTEQGEPIVHVRDEVLAPVEEITLEFAYGLRSRVRIRLLSVGGLEETERTRVIAGNNRNRELLQDLPGVEVLEADSIFGWSPSSGPEDTTQV